MIPCVQTNNLMSTYEQLKDANVYLINEGQFFEDLYEYVSYLLEKGKKVYVCGLDGDFERKKFGQILDLIPHCDKVTKLTSLCSICKNGEPGIFSMRLTNEKCQTLVGSDNYIPVCRKCYENKNNSYV
jgi:thymidine kinase